MTKRKPQAGHTPKTGRIGSGGGSSSAGAVHFEFPDSPDRLHGECRLIDADNFQVNLSVKHPEFRRKKLSGVVSMTYLREPKAHEENLYGVIVPKRWVSPKGGREYVDSIFRGDGKLLDWFANEIASIIGGGEKVCYVGMPTEADLMQKIDTEHCAELKEASQFLLDLHSFEALYDTVVESYKRYLKYVADLSVDSAVEFMSLINPNDMAPMFRTATIDITAFLALFRLYWEILSGGEKKNSQRFFEAKADGEVVDKVVRGISADAEQRIDRVVKGLCPLALHGRPVADLLSWQYKNDENDYHRWFSSGVTIQTSSRIPDHLWNKAKKTLKDAQPMNLCLAEGLEALSSVHLAAREALKDSTADARTSIEAALGEWKETAGKSPSDTSEDHLFATFERMKGCRLDETETYIGVALSNDKHTRLLEKKYRRSPGFPEMTIEVTERYTKKFLHGYKIALLGRFKGRQWMAVELEKRGAVIANRLLPSVGMAIDGGNATAKQKAEAKAHQIHVIDYDLATELIGRTTPPASPKYLRPKSSFPADVEHFAHILDYYEITSDSS